MKRRRAEESADGLALMTSSVTSSYSADGLREQSQESAAIAKRCRLHKLIRQCFALALKIQQEDFALIISRKNQSQDTNWKHMCNTSWTTRRKQQQHPVESFFESAIAISSRKLQYYASSRKDPDARKEEVAKRCIQSQAGTSSRKLQYYASSRKDPDARKEEVAKRCIQSQAETSSRKISSRSV
ncbi:hypothetical protein F511_20264 [Dorcoceras hygrometricum]|uniref:Uncharacterized protein n=1 Tax=Dorcoceras hygrometricum TaxID=472368 RepID=A0A2Z7BRF6_9LAMI|nr:hypothetical protein F511_20264 [Dorcoceras hygrometricum]